MDKDLKLLVREKYSLIAKQDNNAGSCCGTTGCCTSVDYTSFSEKYDHLEGYNPDADLGLGCGIPTEFAHIRKGDTVIDLGSGAGNDCFVARALVGETGFVIGVDMTEDMINKAKQNAEKLNFTNVEFRLGEIENMPVSDNKADVIISNCVLNLIPDKATAFDEIFRVMKPGGHLSVSDVVLNGKLPDKLAEAAEMYAGCVSGAVQLDHYLALIINSGFVNTKIFRKKEITLTDEILLNYLVPSELELYKESGTGIFSITVYAEKPNPFPVRI